MGTEKQALVVKHISTKVVVLFGLDDGENVTPQQPIELTVNSLNVGSLTAVLDKALEHKAAILAAANGEA